VCGGGRQAAVDADGEGMALRGRKIDVVKVNCLNGLGVDWKYNPRQGLIESDGI
jgi:hypothetical protein